MTFIATDAFNNPDSPVYYIVGVVFLLLIFGALAAYLLISKRLEKKKKEAAESEPGTPVDEDTESKNADTTSAEQPAIETETTEVTETEKE